MSIRVGEDSVLFDIELKFVGYMRMFFSEKISQLIDDISFVEEHKFLFDKYFNDTNFIFEQV